MPRAQTKAYKPLSRIRAHKILFLLFIITLLLAGVFIYQKVAQELNKRAFQQARTAIDSVYSDIVTQVGQPDNSKRNNFCSRPNREFEPGPLSCDVSTSFIYGVEDEDQANAYLKKIQAIISTHSSFKNTKALTSSLKASQVVNSVYHTSDDNYRISGIDCVVSYVFNTPREINLTLMDKNKKGFEVSLSCFSDARSQYYPLYKS